MTRLSALPSTIVSIATVVPGGARTARSSRAATTFADLVAPVAFSLKPPSFAAAVPADATIAFVAPSSVDDKPIVSQRKSALSPPGTIRQADAATGETVPTALPPAAPAVSGAGVAPGVDDPTASPIVSTLSSPTKGDALPATGLAVPDDRASAGKGRASPLPTAAALATDDRTVLPGVAPSTDAAVAPTGLPSPHADAPLVGHRRADPPSAAGEHDADAKGSDADGGTAPVAVHAALTPSVDLAPMMPTLFMSAPVMPASPSSVAASPAAASAALGSSEPATPPAIPTPVPPTGPALAGPVAAMPRDLAPLLAIAPAPVPAGSVAAPLVVEDAIRPQSPPEASVAATITAGSASILATAPPPIGAAGRVFAAALHAAAGPVPIQTIGMATRAADSPDPMVTALLASAAPTQPTAPGSATITVDLHDAAWPSRMAERIEALRDGADATSTRLRISPDALGPVDLQIQRDGDRVHVHFAAANPETRALIADAQPQLAAAAADRGLKLGQTSVGAGGTGMGTAMGGGSGQSWSGQSPPSARATRTTATTATADEADTDTRIA